MRHGKKNNHLGVKSKHRRSLLSNLANSLILKKRITTTIAKAKSLRQYVEPLITRSKIVFSNGEKENSSSTSISSVDMNKKITHYRRVVFSYLKNKESVHELFSTISNKVINRNGGYTRIIKTGSRLGDGADMCIIELVDFNTLLLESAKDTTEEKKRIRRGKGTKKESTAIENVQIVNK